MANGQISGPPAVDFYSMLSGLGDTVKTVLWAVVIALLIRTFAFESFNIPSQSMVPTQAQMIAALPGKVRDVFTLRRVYGLSQRDVAAKLGLAESTVEKHMARGFLIMLVQFGYGGNAPPQPSSSGSEKARNPRFDARKDRTSD